MKKYGKSVEPMTALSFEVAELQIQQQLPSPWRRRRERDGQSRLDNFPQTPNNDVCLPLSTKHSFSCHRDEDGNISGTSSGAEFSLSSLQTNIRWEQLRNFERNRVLPFITERDINLTIFPFFSLLAIENLQIHLIWQESRIFFKSRFVLATFSISKCGQFSSKNGKFC